MIISGMSNSMNALRRVGLSLGCLLFSVTLFSLLFILLFGAGAVPFVFRVAIMVAIPVWCLYLPFVIALKDAEVANLDYPPQWDSDRAHISRPLGSHPSTKRRRPT